MKKLLLIALLIIGCATIPRSIPKKYSSPLYEIGMTLKEFKSKNTGLWLDEINTRNAKYYKWEFPTNNPCDIVKMGYLFKKYGKEQDPSTYNSNYSCPSNCSIDHAHIINIDAYKDLPYILQTVRPFKDRALVKYKQNCKS